MEDLPILGMDIEVVILYNYLQDTNISMGQINDLGGAQVGVQQVIPLRVEDWVVVPKFNKTLNASRKDEVVKAVQVLDHRVVAIGLLAYLHNGFYQITFPDQQLTRFGPRNNLKIWKYVKRGNVGKLDRTEFPRFSF